MCIRDRESACAGACVRVKALCVYHHCHFFNLKKEEMTATVQSKRLEMTSMRS